MIFGALVLQVVVFFLITMPIIHGRKISIHHPGIAYLAFHFLVFVLRPAQVWALGYHTQYDYMGFFPSDVEFLLTLAVSSFGLLCFVGTCYVVSESEKLPLFANRCVPSKPERKAFYWTVLLLSPLLLYSIYLNMTKSLSVDGVSVFDAGGINMALDPRTGRLTFSDNTAYLVLAINMIGTLCIAFLWLNRFQLLGWLPMMAYLLFRMSIGGARWSFVMTLASTGLLILYERRRRWPTLRIVAISIVVAVLFSIIGQNRRVISDFISGQEISSTEEPTEGSFGDSPDFANFEFLTYVISKVPDQSGTYSFFSQYLELIVKPFPRLLWQNKPIGSPIEMVNLQEYGNFAGRTPSAVGDGWMSLGWFGVLAVLTTAGYCLGIYYRRFVRTSSSAPAYIAYFLIIPLIIQWARDGGISIAEFLFFVLLPLLIWKSILALTLKRKPVVLGQRNFEFKHSK